MSDKQRILRSEVIIEKYGKALEGKTILITGISSDSIAGELAVQLAAANPKLLILSARAESKVTEVAEKIKALSPTVSTRFLSMDLGSFAAIRNAVNDLADVTTIDHLVCVAGVMSPPYGKTVDGIEQQLAINYVANFLLVKLLLPKIQAAGPSSSVVVVASSMVRIGKMDFDDWNFSDGKTYDPMTAYGQSNAARVMFIKALGEKLKKQKIRAFSVDPGAVHTGLQRYCTPEFVQQIAELRKAGPLVDLDNAPFEIPPWTTASEGAATVVTAMIDPTIAEYTGSYLNRNAVSDHELHWRITFVNNWIRLWELSEELTQEKFAL